ncbi:gamma-glutamyl-gamma-aminobutyrate hydrolase family protein [Rhodococcus sp. HM1]|uniref:type 1 glutamine amidotransferase n=1 Tax=unclassified Rhodococcus (in: high G+C Gram-positive bacteria) TaxID=192944 RepID=UPI0018CECAD1|nr:MULTISPECIES: gamma-glutamyl-gamma-aminobutyrate hydrolase family protein [unclassified Rhodococcus (in: high G+C Gram-positive bacteria)]MBH0122463.1 gamma-glutamyl-gamma-aminobutyrate hydrolase family protein [Rhodococcus sp. CX]MCK8673446.1 gamma-glutamyl-gamma-aminobutyrate hydrolase family protein [Rhodococcus sp. HM1]
MTTGFLELRHVECEGPADYLPALEEFGPVHTVRLWQEPLPETVDYRGIVVMGGPMGANDGAVVPWIDDEIAYLRSALASDVPVWGVCLGAQLLAAALDAKVYSGPAPEVGVCDVELTAASAADPVWGELPASFPTLQWHGDTFDLPRGATLLASSPAYPNQLFRHGRSYGVQFHLEAGPDVAAEWLAIDEYRRALEETLGAGAAESVLAELRSVHAQSSAQAHAVMTRWLESIA